MNPFDISAMADLWLAGGKAMLESQKHVTRAMAESLQALGDPQSGTPQPGDPSPLEAAATDLAAASQSMLEMWTSASTLFQGLAATLPQGAQAHTPDSPALATLRSAMDPRAWTIGGGPMDDVLARMAEGPRFADLWDLERRYARVTAAWMEVRRAGMEHNAVVLDAWTRAGRAFSEEWAGHAAIGADSPDAKAALALWTTIANQTLIETQRSEPFLRTQTATIRASTALRMAQQELVEHVGKQYGFPTRTELDDVHRTLTELRREVRAMKRAQRPAPLPEPLAEPPPASLPAPAPPLHQAAPPRPRTRSRKGA